MAGAALFLLALVAAGCSARYGSRVTVEPAEAEESSSPVLQGERVFPPQCWENAMPEYPPLLTERKLPPVLVRVDFSVDKGGGTEAISSVVQTPTEYADEFRTAAESALAGWTCRPAWRVPRDDEPFGIVPLDYRTWITFRFEAGKVDGEGRLEDPPSDLAEPVRED